MRLKTLNGAPLCEHLDFSPGTLLEPAEAARHLEKEFFFPTNIDASTAPLKWRRLAPQDTRLRTGWSQPYLPEGPVQGSRADLHLSAPILDLSVDAALEDTSNLDTMVSFHDHSTKVNDFVNHSLIFHDTLLSSQVAAEEAADRTISSSSFLGTSFETASPDIDDSSNGHSQGPIIKIPSTLILTSLGSLPSPQHLRAIYPQTLTPSFLCVMTAAPTEREVLVKRGSYKMKLRELVIADNTKAGFKVSFWTRPSTSIESQNDVNRTLERLKVGDIILLRHIALNAFNDKVYGQSLNPSITRVRTTVEILMSAGGISSRQLGALPAPIVAAFMKVKKWANTHVASDRADPRKRKAKSGSRSTSTKRSLRSSDNHSDTLPPDTMESV